MNTYYVTVVLCLIQLSGASESGIVGGKEAKPHSRKNMASLQCGRRHTCGGFLIRDDFVLTAAHCKCNQDLPMTVVLGAHNLLPPEEKSQQRIPVDQSFSHPNYKQYDFDIMLLKLKHKAKKNKNVDIIDLPKKDKEITKNKKCSVAGWGRTDPSEMSPPSNVLRVAEEQTESNDKCSDVWKDYFNSQHMICTKFDRKKGGSVCQGDSGGPLICDKKPLGITAFTYQYDCSNSRYYHVYTKISSFLPWINQVMGGLGNVTKPPTLESQENSLHFN